MTVIAQKSLTVAFSPLKRDREITLRGRTCIVSVLGSRNVIGHRDRRTEATWRPRGGPERGAEAMWRPRGGYVTAKLGAEEHATRAG